MSRRASLSLSLFFLLPACGGDSGNDDGSSGETQSDTSGSTTTGDGDGDGDGNTETGSGMGPALGISITTVDANQGTAVAIGEGAEWVDGANRVARMLKNRDALIRVHHVVDAAWVPREIEARLTITLPGGETIEKVDRKFIEGNSTETGVEEGFYFGLSSDEGETVADSLYQVSLWEVGPGGEGLPEGVNVNPAAGPNIIGFENVDMAMNIKFVPFQYIFNGTIPDIYDENYQKILTDRIYEQKPINALNIEWGDPVVFDGQIPSDGSVCNMLPTMNQIWMQHGAPEDIYFVGIIDSGFIGGTAGCAWLGSMINANVWAESKVQLADTIVHETGHNQGLSHVDCENGDYPAGQEPSNEYPDHPLGRIMSTGFGLRSFSTYRWDTTYDYMTYCGPSWVSPWTWGRTWNWLSQQQSQVNPGPSTSLQPVLHQAIFPDGSTETWTSLAKVDPERLSALHEVEFVNKGEVIARSPSIVDVLTDDKTLWITTPLPEGGFDAEFDSVRDITSEGTREVPNAQIKFIRPN